MKTSQLIRSLLALVVVLSLLAACSSNKDNKPAASNSKNPDKIVELKMVLLGDPPEDLDLVYGELNKKLAEDIQVKVTPEFLSWSDWEQKYPLILASGQDYDLIFTANWADYFKNAANGAFYEITQEALKQYAPETAKNSPQEVFDSATINGKLYGLPMNSKEITILGYVVRGDLMKKAGLTAIQSMDDFGAYLDYVKKNEPDMIPWDTGGYDQVNMFKGNGIFAPGYYNAYSDFDNVITVASELKSNPKIIPMLDVPGMTDFFKKMNEWQQKGYWSKNAMVNNVAAKDSFKNGKSASFTANLLEASGVYSALNTEHPEWDMQFYQMSDQPKVPNPYINNGMAINAKSKHADKALMLLDLLRNNQDYNHLTTYGIKGKHWDLSAEGKLVSLPDSTKYPPDGACPWGWRDDRYYLIPDGAFPNYEQIMKMEQDRALTSNYASFTLDKSKGNLQAIEAAITSVSQQYFVPLQIGFSKDVDKDIETLGTQLEKAGLKEYVAEVQRQIDAYGVTVEK